MILIAKHNSFEGVVFFCDKNYYSKSKNLFDKIESFGYSPILCDIEYKKAYPFDIQLNQAIVGNYIGCNFPRWFMGETFQN